MPKTLCKSVKKNGTPCQGNGLPQFDGYCIAHAPADKAREWRSRGGKATATAARADKRIPDRLRSVIEALGQGINEVREGNLDPAAFSAMCRGAKVLADLYRLADEEMELIRNEETNAAAAEVVGGVGDLAILNVAATITAQEDQYRIESLVDQGIVSPQLEESQDSDQPAEPVLTDAGRRRLGYQPLTKYTQEDIDSLKELAMETTFLGEQLPAVLDTLAQMRAALEEARGDLARDHAPVRDALTGRTLNELPADVKVGPIPTANPDEAEQAAEILADQLQQVNALTREIEEMYED